MAHSNAVYVEYLKLYKLDKQDQPTLEKNRKAVEAHLQKRGYTLQTPLEYSKPLLEKSQVVCKEVHAGNEGCVLPLDGPPAGTPKKKLSVKIK
jgi:hypothetical protein